MKEKDRLMDELIQLREKIVQLEKNDRLFKETEKSGKIGGWQFDPSTLKQTWSEEIFRILEIDLAHGAPEVPKGMEFIDPGFRPEAEKAVQRAMEYGEAYDQEWMVTTYKGNKKWVNAVGNPKMENGKVVSVSGSFQDITSEKITEQELLKNQKRYEKAQAIGNVGNWEYNPVSTNFWASDETKRIYGYDLNMDNFSTDIVENCIPERERVHQALIDLLEHNKKYDLVFDIITYDKGIRKTIRSIAEVERDAEGNPLKVTGVISDITVQKKAEDKLKTLNQQLLASEQQLKASNQQLQANEQQLKAANQQLSASEQQLKAANQQLLEAKEKAEKSEKKFSTIFNMSLSMICVADINTATFKYLNPAFKEVLGYEEKELLSKPFLDFIHPDDVRSTIDVIEKKLKEGIPQIYFENRYKRKDGSYCYLAWNSFPFPEKGITYAIAHDITEQKKTELELIKAKEKAEVNEAKYGELFSSVGDAIFIYNPDTFEIIEANKATSEIYGYSHDELIGMSCLKFSAEVEESKSVAKSIKNEGKIKVNLRHHKKKDGTDIFVELSTYNILVNGKNIFYSVCHDMTDIKKSETELIKAKEKIEESENLLQKAELISDQGSWKWDILNDEWSFSENWQKIHGCAHSGISKDELLEIAHPDDKTKIDNAFEDALGNKKPYSIQHRIIRKDNGEVRDIKATGEVHFSKSGKPDFMIGVARDITDRLKADEKINYQAKLLNVVDQAVIATNPLGKVVYINPAAEKIYGWSAEEILGKTANEIFSSMKMQELGTEIMEALQSGNKWSGEFFVKNKAGHEFWVEITDLPIMDENGKINGIIGVSSDITERKKAEEELIKYKDHLEELVKDRTAELEKKNENLKILNSVFVGRELRMKELKDKIDALEGKK